MVGKHMANNKQEMVGKHMAITRMRMAVYTRLILAYAQMEIHMVQCQQLQRMHVAVTGTVDILRMAPSFYGFLATDAIRPQWDIW